MLKVERRAVYHKGDGGAAGENAWVVAFSRHYVGGFHSKNNDGSNIKPPCSSSFPRSPLFCCNLPQLLPCHRIQRPI